MNTAPISGEDHRDRAERQEGLFREREQVEQSEEKPEVRRRVTAKSVGTFGSAASVLPKLPGCFQRARVDADSLCGILRKWT